MDQHGGRRTPTIAITAALLAVVMAGCTTPSDTGTTTSPSASSEEDSMSPQQPLSAEQRAALDRQLIAAAWANDLARARRLIAEGADVNAKDGTEQSAYLIATSEGYHELLELTLRHGAQVNAKDSFNGTGIIRAAERGHWRIVDRLVHEGVPVDHVNNLGWTGLLEAVILGDGSGAYQQVVRVLLDAGADPTITDDQGRTALQHAEARGQTAVAVILRRAR